MKVLTVVCSYNTKAFTKRIFDEIGTCKGHDFMILDNSNKPEEIPDFGKVHYMGPENVNFGGMIDWVLSNNELLNNYDFIGIFNNDTFGFSCYHIGVLQKYLDKETGIISFSVSPQYDKHAGNMWTRGTSKRESSFIENIAPYFNTELLKYCQKLVPVQKHGLVDMAFSAISIDRGFKNYIIDEVNFHHIRSGTRKLTGSFDDYANTSGCDLARWIEQNPELKKYDIHG
jgi:hypothetical protein